MVREKAGQRKQRRDGGKKWHDDDAIINREKETNNSDSESESETEETEKQPEIELSEKEKEELAKLEKEKEMAKKRQQELDAELMAEFAEGGRTAEDKKNRMKKKMAEGESDSEDEDEAKARQQREMEKLKEVRAQREQQKIERDKKEKELKEKAEKEAKEKEEKSESDKAKFSDVGNVFLKLLREKEKFFVNQEEGSKNGGKKVTAEISINQMNQDADCKKLLKPLLKKHAVKQLNKAFLEKVLSGFKASSGKNSDNVEDSGKFDLWEDEKKIVFIGLKKAK